MITEMQDRLGPSQQKQADTIFSIPLFVAKSYAKIFTVVGHFPWTDDVRLCVMKTWKHVLACGLLVLSVLGLIVESRKGLQQSSDYFGAIYVSNLASYLLPLVLLGSGCMMLFGLVRLLKRSLVSVILLSVGAACGWFGFGELFSVSEAYQDVGRYVAKGGREYHLLSDGFGVRIGKKVTDSPLGTWYQVVAVGPGSYNSKHLKLSKPFLGENALAPTIDEVLVGISGGDVFVGFDPIKGVAYGQTDINGGELASRETSIERLEGKKLAGVDVTLQRADVP
jgi:hypothetical protein